MTKDDIADTLEFCEELKERDQNFLTSPDYIEDLCRLALLGLERDTRAERVGRAAILAVDNGWSAHEVYTEIVEAMYGEPAVLPSTDCPKCGRHDGGIMREFLRIYAPLGKCTDESCPYRAAAMEDEP